MRLHFRSACDSLRDTGAILRFPDRELTSIANLIDHLKSDAENQNAPFWFRGHGDFTWHLEPKLLRTQNGADSESHLVNRFKQHASMLLERRPHSEFDWLFLMQHHGVPTRLLDWSENPLVGLYFAAEAEVHRKEDGALWVLMPTLLNAKSNIRPALEVEIPSFDDEDLKNYLPSTIAREHRSRLRPIAGIAPRNSLRMQAQQGVFTISHRDNTYIDDLGPETSNDHIWRYRIPKDAKGDLQLELKRLGVSRFSMFPELSSIAEIV